MMSIVGQENEPVCAIVPFRMEFGVFDILAFVSILYFECDEITLVAFK